MTRIILVCRMMHEYFYLIRYGDDFLEDSEEDLNKLDDDELQKKKAHMDVGFEKNKKRPGDVGYQYDIQVRVHVSC